MPSWAEALAAIEGIKRLLRFDAGFAPWFDRSAKGAMRSFGLAVPVFPCFLIYYFYGANLRPGITTLHFIGALSVLYALSWIMFPLLLIVIGRAIDRESNAIGAIAFHNWFDAATMIVATPLQLMHYSGFFSDAAVAIIYILIFAPLFYRIYAFRVLIGVGYGGAILLAFLDIVLRWSLTTLLLFPLLQPLSV